MTQALAERILQAVPPDTTVRLETRTGAYIHEGKALVTLWPTPANPREVVRRLSATVAVADNRTMQEDVDFAIRQLVNIGLRALSPAINDPTTAVEAALRVGGLLRKPLLTTGVGAFICAYGTRYVSAPAKELRLAFSPASAPLRPRAGPRCWFRGAARSGRAGCRCVVEASLRPPHPSRLPQ